MYKIKIYPNKILRKPGTPFEDNFDDSLKKIIREMFHLMKKNAGIGLSANQIGLSHRISIIDIRASLPKEALPAGRQEAKKTKPLVLINPKIVKKSPILSKMEEGCLSVPNLYGQVQRSDKIKIEYQNQFGKKITLKAEGLLARVIQHEIDHLNGILFIDKVEPGTLREVTPEDICRDLKIVFIGTSSFGLPTLEELIKNKIIPKLIITEPDRPAGRNQQMTPSPVKEYAKKFRLNLSQPHKIVNSEKEIKQIKPDLIIVASYGQIIPKKILSISKWGSINIHPSLLPKYRGASPIASAILNNEQKTGVSIILMDEKIDHGPIIEQKNIKIEKNETTPDLESRLAKLGAELIIKIIKKLTKAGRKIILKKQNHRQASYAKKFKKTDGQINWQDSPKKIHAQVRALQPWPKAYTQIASKRLIILKTHFDDNKLYIDEVQPEGKKPMSFSDFLRGNPKAVDFFKKISYNVNIKGLIM